MPLAGVSRIDTGRGLEAVICERKKVQGVYIGREQEAGAIRISAMHRYRTVILGGALSLAGSPSPHSRPRIPAGGVGKSALTARFVGDAFLSNYDPTIEGLSLLFFLTAGRRGADGFIRHLRMVRPGRRHNLLRGSPSPPEKHTTDPSPPSSKF